MFFKSRAVSYFQLITNVISQYNVNAADYE